MKQILRCLIFQVFSNTYLLVSLFTPTHAQNQLTKDKNRIFHSEFRELKARISPYLIRKERQTISKINLSIVESQDRVAYIGSKIEENRIDVNQAFVNWVFNRTLAQLYNIEPVFDRTGFLDLYDRLFVYLPADISVTEYARLDSSKFGRDQSYIYDNKFRRLYAENLRFIFLHEFGHFVKQTSEDFVERPTALLNKLDKINAQDTSYATSIQRMYANFEYQMLIQELEVEADAFALEKIINSILFNKQNITDSIIYICNSANSILEAYKHVNNGNILDMPKATCNILIRGQIISYTRDSLATEITFKNDKSSRRRILDSLNGLFVDSVRAVTMVLLSLCENSAERFEKKLEEIINGDWLTLTSWYNYTGVMQNYLASGVFDPNQFSKVVIAINKIFVLENEARFKDQNHSDSSFESGVKEYLHLTLAGIYKYIYFNEVKAKRHNKQASIYSIVIPKSFYK